MAVVVALAATACTPGRRSASGARRGPAAGALAGAVAVAVAGAFGPGVFITAVSADPWAAVGWTTGSDGQPDTACFVSTSASGGRRWKPCGIVPIDTDGVHTRLLGVARVGSTLVAGGVAVGALHGNLRPYLFAGPLSGPLTELNLPRELFDGERVITYDSLTSGPLGAFAVGTWDGVTNQSVAQVWRSTDGMNWERIDGVASMTSTPSEILRGRAVAVGPRRVIVAGASINLQRLSDGDDGALWWSDNGTAWTRANLGEAGMGGAGQQELQAAAALDSGGFLVGGSNGATAAVWWSGDGVSWHPSATLPGGAPAKGVGAVTALAGGGGQEWAAGVVAGSARLWGSSDGRRWSLVALPAGAFGAVGAAKAVSLAFGQGQLLVVDQGALGSTAAVVARG